MTWKFFIITEGSPDLLASWSFHFFKKQDFLRNSFSSVKMFLQWDSCVISRNSKAALLNAWKESHLLTDKKSCTCTEILNLLSVVHEYRTVLKFSFQLNFRSSGGLGLVLHLTSEQIYLQQNGPGRVGWLHCLHHTAVSHGFVGGC